MNTIMVVIYCFNEYQYLLIQEKDIFTDFLNVSSLSIYYEDIFEKYDITHLVIPASAKMGIFIKKDENYNKIYSDDNFVIYERLNNK